MLKRQNSVSFKLIYFLKLNSNKKWQKQKIILCLQVTTFMHDVKNVDAILHIHKKKGIVHLKVMHGNFIWSFWQEVHRIKVVERTIDFDMKNYWLLGAKK